MNTILRGLSLGYATKRLRDAIWLVLPVILS
jgi:hypothetical protein